MERDSGKGQGGWGRGEAAAEAEETEKEGEEVVGLGPPFLFPKQRKGTNKHICFGEGNV